LASLQALSASDCNSGVIGPSHALIAVGQDATTAEERGPLLHRTVHH
jgi:hypothetical protein